MPSKYAFDDVMVSTLPASCITVFRVHINSRKVATLTSRPFIHELSALFLSSQKIDPISLESVRSYYVDFVFLSLIVNDSVMMVTAA